MDGSSSAYSPDYLFDQLLFSKTDLEYGQHTMTIVNAHKNPTEGRWVDVDRIIFTTGDEYVNKGYVRIANVLTTQWFILLDKC
jgi:hypothetical protein